jgi:hypothetical protein
MLKTVKAVLKRVRQWWANHHDLTLLGLNGQSKAERKKILDDLRRFDADV